MGSFELSSSQFVPPGAARPSLGLCLGVVEERWSQSKYAADYGWATDSPVDIRQVYVSQGGWAREYFWNPVTRRS
jgi:hypothetical protein